MLAVVGCAISVSAAAAAVTTATIVSSVAVAVAVAALLLSMLLLVLAVDLAGGSHFWLVVFVSCCFIPVLVMLSFFW